MTATQREGLSDAALALTQPVIDELLKDIARRIKDAGAITDTAEYQIYRAQALGESKQAIKAAVARQIKAQDKVIDSLFDYILDNSTPLTANGSLKQIAEGYAKMSRQKTAEQLKNLWADTPQGKVLPIQDAYAKALDFAFRQTVTGALDTETAIRRACAPLANPYVPFQGQNPDRYTAGRALMKGTLFPGLDLPFMNMVNKPGDLSTPLCELMAMDFVIRELNLYLDTHPDDREAFDTLQKCIRLSAEGRKRYVEQYGPVSLRDLESSDVYDWLNAPWPWQQEGEGK